MNKSPNQPCEILTILKKNKIQRNKRKKNKKEGKKKKE
jgi:hypothetical protein